MRAPRPTAPTRQVVAAALTLLVLGAVGAIQAGVAGSSFMRDLEQVTPPLARVRPVVDTESTPRLSRRVFVVIVDGLRLDHSYELPFLDELRRAGVDSEAASHYPTWSRPNYVSILTGVPPSASGVRTNQHSTPVTLDSLMDRAREAGLRVATATDYDVLPRLFLRPRNPGVPRETIEMDTEPDDDVDDLEDPVARAVLAPHADLVSPFDDARYAPWPGGFSEAGAALTAGNAELIVLLIGAVDAAGHRHGADEPQYRQAAIAADRALSRALAHIDLQHDTVIVTADHGHTDSGGHGGVEPEVVTVPLIAAGAGINRDGYVQGAQLIDIAPTVAALLGIAAPGHGLGRTLTEILLLDAEAAAERRSADQVRLLVTRSVVAASVAAAEVDVLEHRAGRLAVVIAGGVLATLLATVMLRRRAMRLDLRVLVVSVPAFFVVYGGLIAVFGQGFSPSLLPARGHLAETLLRYGLIGMVAQLFANMWALRAQRHFADRLAAANGIAWTGLMLTMVPAGVIWAFFPPPYVTLPEPLWLVLIPAFEVAVACAAINVALTLGVEVMVFVARAWRRDRGTTLA